ncbi:hypothetical protein AB0O76_27475 [Streptomyces sp. NPDC086554]|uniref:hypothetical protein n=1 Tax=Streptomyces sp. NPDC086554 TaxID=3154864 RepID=UPI003417E22B
MATRRWAKRPSRFGCKVVSDTALAVLVFLRRAGSYEEELGESRRDYPHTLRPTPTLVIGPAVGRLERELQEESSWIVKAEPLLDVWIYQPLPQARPQCRIVIITYRGTALMPETIPVVRHEHHQIGLFTTAEVAERSTPESYKRSIASCSQRSHEIT